MSFTDGRSLTLLTERAKVFSSQTVYTSVVWGFCFLQMSEYCRSMDCMMASSSLWYILDQPIEGWQSLVEAATFMSPTRITYRASSDEMAIRKFALLPRAVLSHTIRA